jgi:hypothetical protein
MTGSPNVIAAAVGGLVLLHPLSPAAGAQAAAPATRSTVVNVAAIASGSIAGVVQDEHGAPIPGALVSAFGPRTATAVTDRGGRFEFRTLSPGPYLLRAHVSGYVGSRGEIVEVRAAARTASSIALRRATAIATSTSQARVPVLTATVGAPAETSETTESPVTAVPNPVATAGDAAAAPPVEDTTTAKRRGGCATCAAAFSKT